MNRLFLFSGHSSDNSTVIPHLPIALDTVISNYRQQGAFVKEKVQDNRASEESIERVTESFLRSPKKSVHCASCELEMWSMTVWRVLQKRLHMKPYCLHLLQFLKPTDHIDRTNFCIKMQNAMTEEGFLDRVVFSDESMFHISGKVHRHNVCIRSTENPHEMVQHEGTFPRSMFFAQCSQERFMGLSFSMKTLWQEQVIWKCYRHGSSLDCRKMNHRTSLCSRMGLPCIHLDVRRWLNSVLTHWWIGWGAHEDLMFCPWPAQSPDLTFCGYFLWGYVKDKVFVPPQPVSIPDLKNKLPQLCRPSHLTCCMAGIGLSPRCVLCDEGCTHQTFVGMYHKLVELLFHFY